MEVEDGVEQDLESSEECINSSVIAIENPSVSLLPD
jgi:hypothetical protein